MDDTVSRAEALNLVKDVCNAILSGCGSHYDGEDEVYDDLLEVDAILKCNKEIRIALKHLPSAHPVEDARAMCSECDAWNQYKNYPQPGWIPVVHGHWIRHENADVVDGYLVPEFECSECHSWKKDDSDYCPDCGARMDGKDGDQA